MVKRNDIAELAIKANKRLASLERNGKQSPAYQSAQSRLEMLGTKKNKNTGRRFKESGTFKNKNEALQYQTALENFLNQKTSTLQGYKKYRNKILETANERYNYREHGISDEEYMKIWESLPDAENDRLYGSDTTVEMVIATLKKQRKQLAENEYSVSEIIEKVQSSRNYKDARKSLGITLKDISQVSVKL